MLQRPRRQQWYDPAVSEMMKVVVVGCGSMANTWVREAIACPQIELVGVVDLRRAAAEAMAAKHELPPGLVYDTLEQAVRATRPDAVFDVTIPAAHAAVTLEALSLGCHVLGEKPMSESLDAARQMVAAAEAAGRSYAVTQTRRPLPAFMGIAASLSEGKLGDIAEVHSDFYLGAHFGGFRDAMPHPLLLDMAIHTFDGARQVLGPAVDPLNVYCHAFNPGHSWYGHEASAVAIFEFTGGIVYSYRGSWCAEGRATSWESTWRVVGSRGTLTWDGVGQPAAEVVDPASAAGQFQSSVTPVEVPLPDLKHTGHAYLIRQFAEHVLSGGETELACPAADNIKSLAMVLAAVRSAERGERVAVVWDH